MRGRQLFALGRPLLSVLIWCIAQSPPLVRRKLLRTSRGWGGFTGIGLRYAVLASFGCAPKPNVAVFEHVYLGHVEGIRFGCNVSVHPMCYIDGWGGVDIGDDVSIAHGVTIMSTNHRFDRLDVPIKDQGVNGGRVKIGDDCWIGAQAVILAGVEIGTGSVVAANAVVTKDVPARTIVAGSPAKVIGDRDPGNA